MTCWRARFTVFLGVTGASFACGGSDQDASSTGAGGAASSNASSSSAGGASAGGSSAGGGQGGESSTGGGSGIDAIDTALIATSDALMRSDVVIVPSGSSFNDQSGAAERTIDARQAHIDAGQPPSEAATYLVRLGNQHGGPRQVWFGGTIETALSPATDWATMKIDSDGAGIL